MPYIDFADLKSRIDIMQTAELLALKLKPSGNQHRGPCPACKAGGERALVITPSRGLFYCFQAKTGGDLIKLAAHIEGCSQNDAAKSLQSKLGDPPSSTNRVSPGRNLTSSSSEKNTTKLTPLPYLEPEHPTVQALGVSAATAKAFESGYASKGVLRGRYAVPIHDLGGALLAYVGIAVAEDQSPPLLFHNFDPKTVIFNAHRLAEGGELSICRHPLDLVLAVENGMLADNLVAFLTVGVTAKQLQAVAALMMEKKTTTAQLF